MNERVFQALGIDEKAFKKGHKYMAVVCDLERATVLNRIDLDFINNVAVVISISQSIFNDNLSTSGFTLERH
jgi:hypothetical protein